MVGSLLCVFNNLREQYSQNRHHGFREVTQSQLQVSRNRFSKRETLWPYHTALVTLFLCVGYWRPFALDKELVLRF